MENNIFTIYIKDSNKSILDKIFKDLEKLDYKLILKGKDVGTSLDTRIWVATRFTNNVIETITYNNHSFSKDTIENKVVSFTPDEYKIIRGE